MPSPQPIPPDSTTCLLLIDNQIGFLHPTHWGPTRSNPSYEPNLQALLSAFRSSAPSTGPQIIHIQHLSTDPESPLHASYIGAAGSGFEGLHGVEYLDFAKPGEGEEVVTKGVNSAFIGTDLERMVRERGVRTLIIHCVSTTTRMAANLGVCEGEWGKGRIILATDATATFAKGAFDAATVHAVNVESLRDEFAEVLFTREIIAALREGKEEE